MAASSVTGVGPGSADKLNRGNQHTHLGVENLIGPRVVTAGTAVLNGASPSVANVPFTQALAAAAGYYALLTPVGTGSGAPALNVSAVATTGFTIGGPNGSTATVNWLLVVNPDPAVVAGDAVRS